MRLFLFLMEKKMFKKIARYSVLCLTFFRMGYASETDFITYDWLVDLGKTTAYTDHIPHFRNLFNSMKVRGLLECGCGFSTKYFLDHCAKVVSIEFITSGTNDQWLLECIKLYKDYNNWVPLRYLGTETFSQACGYQCTYHRDYALIDPTYLKELDDYFKVQLYTAYLEGKDIDVAFVDAGVYIRGDMVKVLLANKVPVVVAHDTASDVGTETDVGLYGWFKVHTPTDYEKISIPHGVGTTFWISKKFPDVIASMTAYRDSIIAPQ